MPTHSNNIVVGSGKIYLAFFDDNGAQGGFRYIGDTPGFTVEVTTERITVYGSDESTRQKIIDKVIEVERSFSLTARDVTPDNTAMFMGGDAEEMSQSQAAGETQDILGVQQGYWYNLEDTTNPTGVRNISSVGVTDKSGSPSHTVGDDFEVDEVRGRIYIVEGGAITDDDDLEVTYDVSDGSRSHVKTTDQVSRKVALHFIADNNEGENSDVLIPYCEIGPDGEFAFKDLENPVELSFTGQILTKDSSTAQVYVDGESQ